MVKEHHDCLLVAGIAVTGSDEVHSTAAVSDMCTKKTYLSDRSHLDK